MKWLKRKIKQWKEDWLENCKESNEKWEKIHQRERDVRRKWQEEQEREQEDWKQLSPIQRAQIRAIKSRKHKHDDSDDGRFWPFGEDGFAGGG